MADRQVEENIKTYMKTVKALDPELYAIKLALLETRVNPAIVLEFIRSMSLVVSGTGYGEISIQLRKGKVGLLKATEHVAVDTDVLLEKTK